MPQGNMTGLTFMFAMMSGQKLLQDFNLTTASVELPGPMMQDRKRDSPQLRALSLSGGILCLMPAVQALSFVECFLRSSWYLHAVRCQLQSVADWPRCEASFQSSFHCSKSLQSHHSCHVSVGCDADAYSFGYASSQKSKMLTQAGNVKC